MTNHTKSDVHLAKVGVFLLLFSAVWVGFWFLHVAINRDWHDTPIGGNTDLDVVYWCVAKGLAWVVLPALYFGRLVDDLPGFIGLGTRTFRRGLRWSVGTTIAWLVLSLVASVIARQHPSAVGTDWIVIIYSATFTPVFEEILTRGFLLASLLRAGTTFWTANCLVTVYFIFLHIVGWTFQGQLLQNLLSTDTASIALLSLYTGYLRVRSRSLVAGIVVHSANNLWSSFWSVS